MKKILFLLIMALGPISRAQVPIPELCAVSVDTSVNHPVIYWTISDTSAIDGFIIKRIIYNGTGVIDGTLNNIAVIASDTVTQFTDTSTAYNTQARPDIRAEKYVVVAYDTSRGQIVYSGFSASLSSIYLQTKYDSCNNIIRLRWQTNQNISKYFVAVIAGNGESIIAQTSDTALNYIPEDNGTFSFVVKALPASGCIPDTLLSNKTTVTVNHYQRPQLMYIHGLQANFDDTIKIKIIIQQRTNPAHILLLRDGQEIATFDSNFDGYIYDHAPTDTLHTYWLRAYSSCSIPIDSSAPARNIILNGQASDRGDTRINILNWNSYPYWAGQTLNYKIFLSQDGINFTQIATTSDTSYQHNLHDLIINNTLTPEFYYYIEAEEINDTLIWQNTTATSNITKLEQQPLLHLPNTINPLSPNPIDREFRIYADFIKNYSLNIYDRYGRIVFHSNSPDQSWNGHLPDGKIAPRDTYFYLLKYEVNGKKMKLHGSINVVY